MSNNVLPPSNNSDDDASSLQNIAKNAKNIQWLLKHRTTIEAKIRWAINQGDPTYTEGVETLIKVLETTFTDPRFAIFEHLLTEALICAFPTGKEELLTKLSLIVAQRNCFLGFANRANAAIGYAYTVSENDRNRHIEVLSRILEISLLRNDYPLEMAAYDEAIDFCRETGNLALEADLHLNIAYTLLHQGNYESAQSHATIAYELHLKLHDSIHLFRSILALVCIARYRNHWKRYEKFLRDGWDLFEILAQTQDIHSPKMLSRHYALLHEQASFYLKQQQYTEAIVAFQKALDISTQALMDYEITQCHESLALAYNKVGDFEATFHHLEQAEKGWKQMENPQRIVNALYIRGFVMAHQSETVPNRKTEAIAVLSEALEQAHHIADTAARHDLIKDIRATRLKLIERH